MKKQLVLLSLLMGTLSLWGMEVDSESRMKFMQALETPLVQHALVDTAEKKEALSLNLFKRFHQKAFDYFRTDQTEEERSAILTWIRMWLPLMDMQYTQEEGDEFKAFLHQDIITSRLVTNIEIAGEFFTHIYVIYLRKHQKQLCKVLFSYFHMDLIENKYYRYFLLNMFNVLGHVADNVLSAPTVKGAPEIKRWSDVISIVSYSIENYGNLSGNKGLFSKHWQSIQAICENVNKALQEKEQTEKLEVKAPSSTDKELQGPIITEEQLESPSVILPSKKDPVIQNEQRIALPETSKKITIPVREPEIKEIIKEPTFWDKLVDGWNRFLNMLKLMGGV